MNHMIDRTRREPLYRQIAKTLEEEIRSSYREGSPLPTEAILSQRFGVNRHTLRRAVDGLVEKGLVERRRGKGMFVLTPLNTALSSLNRLTESLSATGRQSETTVLRKLTVPATKEVASRLRVPEGRPVHWIETLRVVDAQPFCVTSHYLVREITGPVFEAYEGGALHSRLRHILRLDLERHLSLIAAIQPQGRDAAHLMISRNQPILRVKSVNSDRATGRPVEYAVCRFRADRVELSIAD